MFITRILLTLMALAAIGASLSGCATYQTKVGEARSALAANDPTRAVSLLEPLANKNNDDQLVYLLDYATALQKAGRFKESAQAYQKAESMTDIKDYHSIGRVTSSLLLSEEMVQYKGDDYEKVLINAMNAVNYLEIGDLDEALVEVRRLNNKLYRYKYEAKRDYEQNPFAFYLSAVIWEADRKWDDAYIAYKNAYDLIPDYAPLRADLIRLAIRAQRPEELAVWRKKFPEVKILPEWKDATVGEVVLVFTQGWGPRKQPRPDAPRFPYLVPTPSVTKRAQLIIDGDAVTSTRPIFSVQNVAIRTLNDDFARLVASRAGGMVAKAVVADQLRQRNEALGAVAFLAMNLADRADVRQWSTLPESFQIARIFVGAGKYKVKVQGLDYYGNPTGEIMAERDVEVKPRRKAFVTFRAVR